MKTVALAPVYYCGLPADLFMPSHPTGLSVVIVPIFFLFSKAGQEVSMETGIGSTPCTKL